MHNIHIILVEPQYAGNVGAIARSAYNFGVTDIRLVGKLDFMSDDGKKMSMYAKETLRSIRLFVSLSDAINDCTTVIGAVHQTRFNRKGPIALWDICEERKNDFVTEDVALVFGREDNGLTREEIDQCHHLAVIPTPTKLSFNLAHSVTAFLVEIYRVVGGRTSPRPVKPPQKDYEKFFEIMNEMLETVEFFKGSQEAATRTMIRDIVYRAQLCRSDLPVLQAIMYKIIRTCAFLRAGKEKGKTD